MASNPFLQDKDFYKRDINPVGHYIHQMATMLSIKNSVDYEEAKRFIVEKIETKTFPNMKDPIVDFFGKDENLDRTQEQMPLTHYLADILKNRQILVPTFTAYCHPSEESSPLSAFIGENVKKRSVAKKLSQKAKAEGNDELAFSKNIEQANKKENNNSLSGAFATDSSIFENPTGHNTLTSITRSMASIGNALNERMLGGNRHYRTKEVAFNNIAAIVSSTDAHTVMKAVETFNLKYPSPGELMKVLKKSMQYYIFDKTVFEDILYLARKMEPWQRAAVAYNQDFYHLRELNPQFVRTMLEDFAYVDRTVRYENPIGVIRSKDGSTINYAHQVLIEEVKGMGLDYEKMPKEVVDTLANVCTNIEETVQKYRPVINAFFLTKTVPSSTAYIQDMVRTSVVLSDTDSTMFSIDEWVQWFFGELQFSQRACGIAGAVMYISTQCIAHCLAILSGNMGVADEHLFTLAMKPEFFFPVFVQSPVSKHYFTAKLVCEGVVYKDIEMEIKGVHNKNSAMPGSIIDPAQELMEEIIRIVMDNKKISIHDHLKSAADVERKIMSSLQNSEIEYLKKSSINEASSYKLGPLLSNYAHHTLWEEVFAPKYGSIAPPPYDVVKIPTILTTPTAFKKWIAGISDRGLAARLEAWALRHNKTKLPTFYFSMDMVQATSIPMEVSEVIDFKKIILDLTNVRRMLLDSLGHPCRSEVLITEIGY